MPSQGLALGLTLIAAPQLVECHDLIAVTRYDGIVNLRFRQNHWRLSRTNTKPPGYLDPAVSAYLKMQLTDLLFGFSNSRRRQRLFFHFVVGRHLKQRLSRFSTTDVSKTIDCLARARIGVLCHDKRLKVFRVPSFINDLNWTLVANLSCGNCSSDTGTSGRYTFDGFRAQVFFFRILRTSVTSCDLVSTATARLGSP